MEVDISTRRVLFVLLTITGILLALHSVGQISRLAFGHANLKGLVPLFCVEDEFNVPSFWSAILWLMSGAVSGFITLCERRAATKHVVYWAGICILCSYFALDETVQIHERLGTVMVSLVAARGGKVNALLYYLWVVPGGLFALAVFVLYSRFLLALPRRVAVLFVVSGVLFLSGALCMELYEGTLDAAGKYMGPLYTVCVTIEEGLEMVGVSVFVYTLLEYVATAHGQIELKVSE
ncbi:MAG: hypothetical protein K1Y02_14775 [Candidatus Hydrogenedentes bacterium]|nr:hypothetical protein [Candidatus Hydrogenedentota bacterium]